MAHTSESGSLEQAVLDYVNKPEYRPAKQQSLSRKLGVRKKHREKFELLLNKLHSEGRLRISESGRVQANAPSGLIAGVMRKRSSGAGFVIPHPPLPQGVTGDLYVHPEDMHDAHNGDEVLVRLRKRRGPGGRRCAIVAEVVERATNVFVGEYFEEGEQGYVEIDGTNFTEPVWVGDPGAKGAQEGDQVVIEMIRFPTQHMQGEAVLTQVLGPRGEPGVDTLTIIHEFGLRDEFPEEVLEAARLEAENFDENDLTDREDLTGEVMVTIDPVDARDFDDAISLTRSDDGHWHLGVHIADVAHFVQPGTPLDREAQLRGTSVYLPTKVIPMLPEVLSNSLASLQEKRVRFAKSVFIEYTPEGVPVHTRFARSAIKVNKRFAYEQVLPIIQSEAPQRGRVPAKIRKLLVDMHELAMLLRRRRFDAGAMNLDIPEIKLEFDKDGRVSGAHETVHDESHQIIEEFMLAANIAVATELSDRGIEFLRRTHGQPSEKKMQAFGEFAKVLGYRIKNPQSKAELQRLLEQAAGTPEERAIHYALLRSFKQAQYSPLDTGHYALAVQNYCHFTSPIRRYPDLTIHRWIDALLLDNKTYRGPSGEELMRLGRQCSTTERRAADAERELTHIKLLAYLETRIDSEWDAVITGVDRYGFFARGLELPAEGLVHIGTLSSTDYYEYDRDAHSLVGRRTGERFRLGDRVRVRVAHVDVGRRQLDFRLVRHQKTRRPKRKTATSSKRSAPTNSQATRTRPKKEKKSPKRQRKSPKGRK